VSEEIKEVVRAKRFELVDDDGHARAKLFLRETVPSCFRSMRRTAIQRELH
jgi:hypothetical protein